MASHGVPRSSGTRPTTDEDRKKEPQKITQYKNLVESVTSKIKQREFTSETLAATSELLKWNPEYYTAWNHRRLIIQHLLSQFEEGNLSDVSRGNEETVNIISDNLGFIVPLLRKFPKCYWIWNFRLWLLQESTKRLPPGQARKFWEQELALASKMLSLDSRNFNGWGYRRTVIAALESSKLQLEGSPTSLTEQEFEYTTKMINSNLSNFSAWHNRSKLIPRLLQERDANDTERRRFLDEELALIQRALWAGDHDQSLWFYHQNLMCTFDPLYASGSMAPNLSLEDRERYLLSELDKVMDMLDGAEDCKWIYQSLIHLSMLYKQLSEQWPPQAGQRMEWLEALVKLDPLRVGRWRDLRSQIEV